MDFGFLFWLFLIGLIVAALQDLKRREVDDWLNLFLIVASFSFIFLRAIFESNGILVYQLGFAVAIMFALMNLFYYGHVFAGGDAKLLFAMTALFIGVSFIETLINIGTYTLFLMFAGSIYGLLYSLGLYFANFKKVNAGIKKRLGGGILLSFVIGTVLLAGSFFNIYFLILGVFAFLFPLLYIFAKGLENISMIKTIKGEDLREGDWLFEDVTVNGKTILANWDGVSRNEMKIMKNLKQVKIKEGIPFIPAFLLAFFFYVFFKDFFLSFFIGAV
ncbi:MAG: prepilin peptidase [Nanoarchaeota archaeon]|nr:prepilin peptidase [Nanoarchaeota archaeon]